MKDRLGRYLGTWRTRVVLPHVRGRLLDLGCGANHLVRQYGNGLGVDVCQWGDVDVVVEDAGKLPFKDASFDSATIVAALNHIPNRQQALRELHRVLRPGGLAITTMIPPRLSRVWHALRKPWDADQSERGMKEGEVYGLTASQVRQLLTSAGFRVQRQKRFMLGLNMLTLAQKPGCPSD